jgi:serine protease Do
VAEIPEDKVAKAEKGSSKSPEAKSNRLGLVVSELNEKQREKLNVTSGLLVEDVRENSRGDFRPGDILLAMIVKGVNTELKTVEQFNKLLAQTDKASSMTLLVRRDDQQVFVTIKGNDK